MQHDSLPSPFETLNVDPLEMVLRIAAEAHAQGDLALAGKLFSEACKYHRPQLKHLAHEGQSARTIVLQIDTGIETDDALCNQPSPCQMQQARPAEARPAAPKRITEPEQHRLARLAHRARKAIPPMRQLPLL